MKTNTNLWFLLSTMALTSCYQASDTMSDNADARIVNFDLTCSGIEQESLTRALKEPVQLLVFDSCNGVVTVTEKESFSSLALPLRDGLHDLYFMAASRQCQSYDKDQLTVTWPNNLTGYMNVVWAYHYQLNVSEGTIFEEIELPLVVADVKVNTIDNLPNNAGTLAIEAPEACTTLDLTTMQGTGTTGVNYRINIGSDALGKRLSVNIYTFVPESGTVGDIALTMYDRTNTTTEISSRTISAVPVNRGYISDYSGYFFSEGISIPLSHSQDWLGTHEYGY